MQWFEREIIAKNNRSLVKTYINYVCYTSTRRRRPKFANFLHSTDAVEQLSGRFNRERGEVVSVISQNSTFNTRLVPSDQRLMFDQKKNQKTKRVIVEVLCDKN